MADRKITDLTALAAGSQATGDLLTIVDVSEGAAADKNKKITVESLFKGIPGNVGIGTSSPQRALVVSDAGAEGFEFFPGSSDTGNTLNHYDRGSSAFIDITTNADKHIFGRADGEKMRIDSSGNVGIGTTSASSILHLEDSNNTVITLGNSSYDDGVIQYYNGSVLLKTGSSSGDRLMTFSTAGSERMRIDSSGRLLVGTSSQSNSALLTVEGNTGNNSGAGELTLQRGEAATSITANESIGHIYFQDNSNKKFAEIACFADAAAGSNDYPGRLLFSTTADSSSSPTERMRIASSGKVGIGETSVQSTLHVAKNIADSDAISWANSQLSVATPIAGNSTANRATIYFAPYGSDNNYAPSAISATAGTSGASTLKFFTNASGNLTGQVQSYERMRILSSGGITFNGDTAQANALDDYEEGTFTPAIENTGYTYTYGYQEGTYTKIGRLVTLRWRLSVTARSGSASGGHAIIRVPTVAAADGTLDSGNFNFAMPSELIVHKAGTSSSSGAKTLLFGGFANSATAYFWVNNPTITGTTPFDLGANFNLGGVITYTSA